MKRLAVRLRAVRCSPLALANFTGSSARGTPVVRPAEHQNLFRGPRESRTTTAVAGRGVVLPPSLARRRSRFGRPAGGAIVVFPAVRVTVWNPPWAGRTANGGKQGADCLPEGRPDHFVFHGSGLGNARRVAAVRSIVPRDGGISKARSLPIAMLAKGSQGGVIGRQGCACNGY